MYIQAVFIIFAQIGLTFAGFSGIASIFGKRKEGEWTQIERFRLTNLLISSLYLMLNSLFLIALLHAGLPEKTVWFIGSLSTLLMVLILAIRGIVRSYKIPIEQAKPTHIVGGSVYLSVLFMWLFMIYNAVYLLEFWPIIIGCTYAAFISSFQFVKLVLDVGSYK